MPKRKGKSNRNGKRVRADREQTSVEAIPLDQAVATLKKFKATKFDQSVDIALYLGIDTKQSEQGIRGSLALPHGVGKSKRVIAFCAVDKVADCKAAGALEAGGEELVKKIEDGWMEFDVAVAEPTMMRIISKLGRVLGPKGLMPSPKSGTVNANVAQAVKEYAAGKVEFKNDKQGNVHASIGRLSFSADQIRDNAQAFIDQIQKMKPTTTKGQYLKRVCLSGTMTPSVTVAV
ncbi:MAG: 50S ribosomal protein L1 [Phycisphaeraceae bacterium]|nr:50S ribosomal protein L1 [Phycisphaeraceae bacterium]